MHFSDTFVISFWQTQASSDDATRMLHASSGRFFWGQNFFWCQNLFQVIYNHNLRSNVAPQFFLADHKERIQPLWSDRFDHLPVKGFYRA